ncbi:ATP-binding cassette domain-containing protein [Mycolicibacterium smegmatis]|uniref:ATP-binding cassette domain-containing protein n=1 Tax=Mycolicibacterium smegmatis TaxID=1772 RepID=UPI0005D9E4A1|nr:ATP-binding cassette domain-containing protein [Mycolicibacterium smegmatis]MDF1897778.1 ATP-binding cassette domain-containing protein [Mycolicibacterium smegmatis]MDF1904334.1 ATP-binding cassette domain-containing protein [Mycolicibacterium smegmatis]MDF1917691.1 ATP-binding cassette domain-containing protein [Mycolicibacterium smegmatis]MDF1923048.1 ATP-binding cassette domain-containing protein [Mycolicibacterium smegmatis]UAK58171.1 ATP-binding cassette domain-containing protein [Myco
MSESRVLLRTVELRKEFPIRGRAPMVAVDNVSLQLQAGETLGVVGESGSGKTTLARMMLGLLEPTSGRVEVNGRDLATLPSAELRALRRDLQVVLQDPFSSMNPRMRVVDIVAEPLVTHEPRLRGRPGRTDREQQVAELLTAVGLDADIASRYPHEFSGGQRQRISIARALALRPEVIVLDEPTSALDVSVQAQVLDLLSALQAEFHLSYVFVSHNLAVVRKLADRVAVMRYGKVVEFGPVATVFDHPSDPYTQALLDAVLEPDPRRTRRRRTVDVA